MQTKRKAASMATLMVLLFIVGQLAITNDEFTNRQFTIVTNAELAEIASSERYTSLAEKEDPKRALTLLREETQVSDSLLEICHNLTHEIGHIAYEKYGGFSEAMRFQDEICNSGYQHGVIEAHFIDSSDIKFTMHNTCALTERDFYTYWQCLHGIGHGLMYFSDNDLPGTLQLCDTFGTKFERQTCANGAFMENFAVDGEMHTTKYVKEGKWLYPCAEQMADYKTDCYLYVPTYYLSLHGKDYEGALEVCEMAENGFTETCIKGVGSQMIKENINHPLFVESICEAANEYEVSCIEGMVALYTLHFGGTEEATVLCPKLKKKNQAACERKVEEQSVLFGV